jgi:hypothetical protein
MAAFPFFWAEAATDDADAPPLVLWVELWSLMNSYTGCPWW